MAQSWGYEDKLPSVPEGHVTIVVPEGDVDFISEQLTARYNQERWTGPGVYVELRRDLFVRADAVQAVGLSAPNASKLYLDGGHTLNVPGLPAAVLERLDCPTQPLPSAPSKEG